MAKTKSSKTNKVKRVPQLPADQWEQGWQNYWKQAGFTSYELPADAQNKANSEYQFLMTARTVEHEKERLIRIQEEFIRGFKGLYDVGPAVTVFGSARFKRVINITNWHVKSAGNWRVAV